MRTRLQHDSGHHGCPWVALFISAVILSACGDASGNPGFDPIDQQFNALQTGHVLYALPKSMVLGDSSAAIARVSKSLPDDMTADLQVPLQGTKAIKVSDTMEAELTPNDAGLHVQKHGVSIQLVGERAWSEWSWSVSALQPGLHHLSLSLTLFLPSGSKSVPVIDLVTHVIVTAPAVIANLYSTFGVPAVNGMIGAILGGGSVLGGLWAWVRRRAGEVQRSSFVRAVAKSGAMGFGTALVLAVVGGILVAAANPIPTQTRQLDSTLPVTPVASAPSDPRKVLLPEARVLALGNYTKSGEGESTDHNWNGWVRTYSGKSDKFLNITTKTYVLPPGIDAIAALKAASCDFKFGSVHPSSTLPDTTTAPGATVCIYKFANGAVWMEYEQVVRGVVIEVGGQPSDPVNAEPYLFEIAHEQLVYAQNQTA